MSLEPQVLPDEIIASILYHANRLPSRIQTLKSCSLVSRAFANPAQSLIFSTINFDISRTSRFLVFQSLCATLLRNRTLGLYVKELQVRSDSPDVYELHIPAFNAFRTLHNLRKFTFICGLGTGSSANKHAVTNRLGFGSEGSAMEGHSGPREAEEDDDDSLIGWPQFAKTNQANLSIVFNRPSLRALELGGLRNLPLTFLLSFLRLEHLILNSNLTADLSQASGSDTQLMVLSNIKLRRLTLREVGAGLINAIASMLAYKPDGLKKLDLAHVRLVGVEDFANAAWNLVRIGGRALEEFGWEGVVTRPNAFKPIDLTPHRSTIKRLTVSVTYRVWFAEPQVLADLQSLLRQLAGPDSALEVLTIRASFAGSSSSSSSFSSSDRPTGRNRSGSFFDITSDPEYLEEWAELDKILSHKKSFRKLDRIELEYVPSSTTPSKSSTQPTRTSTNSSILASTRNSTSTNSSSGSSSFLLAPAPTRAPAELELTYWWQDTAWLLSSQLAHTRAKGVIVTFGESRSTRREWVVFDGRSPPVSPSINGVVGAEGGDDGSGEVLVGRNGALEDGNSGWLPMRI
ncbi:hypothetical protein EST38_g4446 [Candolleomyces aberdarensis]|uniref:Uncharacterized protein n=1 Tax=Candolleomyces aberdarensis TaxID=2316362 RepID=A0A4Q2DR82_9AGAR|nr:hypothetical protein EST38_g4446 [Candolleomyces aberdarensis]